MSEPMKKTNMKDSHLAQRPATPTGGHVISGRREYGTARLGGSLFAPVLGRLMWT